jgi:hypothetical protein
MSVEVTFHSVAKIEIKDITLVSATGRKAQKLTITEGDGSISELWLFGVDINTVLLRLDKTETPVDIPPPV